jgi:hypothetical protein
MKTLIGIMKEPRSPAAARVHAAEVILDRGWGKAAQLIAPADDARLGFSEIKLVIIDTAQLPETRVIEHDRIVEHTNTVSEPALIEAKQPGRQGRVASLASMRMGGHQCNCRGEANVGSHRQNIAQTEVEEILRDARVRPVSIKIRHQGPSVVVQHHLKCDTGYAPSVGRSGNKYIW